MKWYELVGEAVAGVKEKDLDEMETLELCAFHYIALLLKDLLEHGTAGLNQTRQ